MYALFFTHQRGDIDNYSVLNMWNGQIPTSPEETNLRYFPHTQTWSSLLSERQPNICILTYLGGLPSSPGLYGDVWWWLWDLPTLFVTTHVLCSFDICLAFCLASSSFIRLTLELKARFCSVQRYCDVCILSEPKISRWESRSCLI